MPSWVRVGQQVTLLKPMPSWAYRLADRRGDVIPELGKVYTISLVDMEPSRRGTLGPWLQFKELRNTPTRHGPGVAKFRWTMFRPVTKSQATQAQDVALFKHLLTPARIPVDS